jgi:hypothetical protein
VTALRVDANIACIGRTKSSILGGSELESLGKTLDNSDYMEI